VDPQVRMMPDKRNDQIESSPKEENRRLLETHDTIAHFCKGALLSNRYYRLYYLC